MRRFWVIARRELAAFFLAPASYVVAVLFLLLMGFIFYLICRDLRDGSAGLAAMQNLFLVALWIALPLAAPVLTMRLFAEERRQGTFETLMTAPVRTPEVVLGKYAAALAFFIFLWLPTLLYAGVLHTFSPLSATSDLGALAGGYLGVFVIGAFYLAIGTFTSACTRSQVVAAVFSSALIWGFFFAGYMLQDSPAGALQHMAAYFSPLIHLSDFARGAVDTRPLAFYGINTVFLLFAAVTVVEARKGR